MSLKDCSWHVVLFGAGILGASLATAADDIIGTWLVEDGDGAVQIVPCDGATLCGRLVWFKRPPTAPGGPVLDAKNPNPALRSRPLCGLEVVTGLKGRADGSWGDTTIYDPAEGKTYNVEIRRVGADALTVTGYLGTKLLVETVSWRRARSDLARCGRETQKSHTP